MRPFTRMLLLAALLLSPTRLLLAQTAVDPAGHWEGAIHAPGMEVSIEIDMAKSGQGEFTATFSNPAQNIKGFPLSNVAVEDRSVSFLIKTNGGGAFKGSLSEDGKSISGDFTSTQGGFALPFSLVRTGDARIEPPAKSPRIGHELEGTWTGTLEVNGTEMRVVLKMSNQPDGTSTGTVANLDQGDVEIPVTTISQKASSVSLDVKVVGGAYSGVLNPGGTELAGTWTQGAFAAPLTFRHAAAGGRK